MQRAHTRLRGRSAGVRIDALRMGENEEMFREGVARSRSETILIGMAMPSRIPERGPKINEPASRVRTRKGWGAFLRDIELPTRTLRGMGDVGLVTAKLKVVPLAVEPSTEPRPSFLPEPSETTTIDVELETLRAGASDEYATTTPTLLVVPRPAASRVARPTTFATMADVPTIRPPTTPTTPTTEEAADVSLELVATLPVLPPSQEEPAHLPMFGRPWITLALAAVIVSGAALYVQRAVTATSTAEGRGEPSPMAATVAAAASSNERAAFPATPASLPVIELDEKRLEGEPSAPSALASKKRVTPRPGPKLDDGALPTNELLHLAHASLRSGDAPRARERFRLALASDPTNVEAHAGLGDIAYRERDLVMAKEHYARALDRSPAYIPARLSLADVTWELGDRTVARRHYAVVHDRLGVHAPARARERHAGNTNGL